MLNQFDEQYADYMRRVPAFFPPRHQWKALFTTPVPEAPGNGVHD